MKFKNKLLILLFVLFTIASIFLVKIYAVSFPKPYRRYVSGRITDENLIYAVIRTESGFRSKVKSSAGAVGLMQIMPETAFFVKEKYSLPDGDLFDPVYNILIGTHFLDYLTEKYSDRKLVLACYNAGEGRVLSWLKDERYSPDGKTLEKIPFSETKNYIERIEKNYKIYQIFY